MQMSSLSLSTEAYRCEPCSVEEGRVVRELVRMIPLALVIDGEMVGEEFWCCPVCRQPKFSIKSRKKIIAKHASKAA